MAVTSHFPHALANLILNHAGSVRVNGHEPLATAGGSLRDMTRVAGRQPAHLGRHLPRQRRGAPRLLAEHRRRVEDLERALASGDAGLARPLDRGGGREPAHRFSTRPTAMSGRCNAVRVHVPRPPRGPLRDHAGASAPSKSTSRTSSSSTCRPTAADLSVLVAGEDEARRAAALLEAQGYSVIVSPAFEDE
jgi:hypothetical protein